MINDKIKEAKESARPANIELITITDSTCKECFMLNGLIAQIKNQNVNVTKIEELDLKDDKANELIKQYNLTKIPILLSKGEIYKDSTLEIFWNKLGKIEDDTFILTQIASPHISTLTGEMRGKVELTLITEESCTDCYDVKRHISALSAVGIKPYETKTIDYNTLEGKQLARKYSVKYLPTIILTGDLDVYPSFKSIWTQVGTAEDDGAHIFRIGKRKFGTYREISTWKIVNPDEETK